MGQYTSFIKDFPARCRELLETYPEERLRRGLPDRSVTTMLCVASAVLTIPRERLQQNKLRNGTDVSHPERQKFEQASAVFDADQNALLTQSRYWSVLQAGVQFKVQARPTEFNVAAYGSFPEDYQTWEFFRVLRNALAHGNIYTGFDPKRITNLTFGSNPTDKRAKAQGLELSDYELITLEVDALSAFLHVWLDFLTELPLPEAMQNTGQAAD
ncbi:hypothetical protein [Deinococcus marmoris]|uniref:hypothetical protein n=1 Tax=Deinococcus marmoris TaxID=249408 RepID=UPI00049656DD|nr:hypothetical protein [Deinococcus marmoris]